MDVLIVDLVGIKWCIVGKNVLVDRRYVKEYKSTVRRKLPLLSRPIMVNLVAYAAMFLGVVGYAIYLVHL